jgi:hypothetical protein
MSAEITFIEASHCCDTDPRAPSSSSQNYLKDFYAEKDGTLRVYADGEAAAITIDEVTTTVAVGSTQYFDVKAGTWVLVALGAAPYCYFSASALSGSGTTITDPMPWSQANLDSALAAGKIVRLIGPAATPLPADAGRSDEFPQSSSGWIIKYDNAVIEGVSHPSNPGTKASFCGQRTAWTKPGSESPTSVSAWTAGQIGFSPKAKGITIRNIHFRRIGTAIKMGDAGANDILIENCSAYNVQRFLDQPTNIRATGSVTFASLPANNATVTINGQQITFVMTVTDAKSQVQIGSSTSDMATKFRDYVALNYKRLLVSPGSVPANVVPLVATLLGVDGNTITLATNSGAVTLSGIALSGGSTITNDGGIVRNLTVTGFSKALLRNSGNSSGWLFKNIIADSGWQSGDSFPRLWNANDTAHNIRLEDCTASNIYDTDSTYWNGDGFECNDGNKNITFVRCQTEGATDGGFDCKGMNIIKIDCQAESCKRLDRNWGEVTSIGSTYSNPTNRGTTSGELNNGSAFVFVNGYFDTTITGTDPWDKTGASPFRGNIIHKNCTYIGDGDAAVGGHLQSKFLLIGGPGGVARFVNCTRRSALTGNVDAPLTLANAGDCDVAQGKAIFYNDPDTSAEHIGCQITTNLSQTAIERSEASIKLTASVDGTTIYQDCTWELDRTHPLVINGQIRLTSWTSHSPHLRFTDVPLVAQSPTAIKVTVVDAAGNRNTKILTVTSEQPTVSTPPVFAGSGALKATGTPGDTSVKPPLPTGVLAGDIIVLVATTSKTDTDPTMPSGYTKVTRLEQSTPTYTSWVYWKLAGASESDPTVEFSAALASGDIHAAQTFLIRNARNANPPFDVPSGGLDALGALDSSWGKDSTAPSITPNAGNRLIVNIFVMNNDCTDTSLGGTSSSFTEVSNEINLAGNDISVFVATKNGPNPALLVTGATVSWTNANTNGQNFTLAFQPKVDP